MPEIIPNWHPMAVHFAIALLLSAVLLFILSAALARRDAGPSLTAAARCNLGLGLVAALLALGSGWHAYDTVRHDAASHANMTVHMKWAFATTGLFAVTAGLASFDRRRPAGLSLALLLGLVAGAATLAVTGWFGAENVYRYGLGVMSLPADDDHQHAGHHHDHADNAETGATGDPSRHHEHEESDGRSDDDALTGGRGR